MDNKYLLKYLQSFYHDPIMDRVFDYFKMDLDWYIYHYGKNLTSEREARLAFLYESPKPTKKERVIKYVKGIKHRACRAVKKAIKRAPKDIHDVAEPIVFSGDQKKVLSYEDVSWQVRLKFAEKNVEIVTFNQLLQNGNKTVADLKGWYESFNNLPFNLRIEKERYGKLDELFKACQSEFCSYSGLFTRVDAYFMQKFLIDVFKSINLPTYIILHGLPGVYNSENSRSDYLLVWGEAIKNMFIAHGFDSSRVFVVGNPNYLKIPHHKQLRNSFDDVLVLTTTTVSSERTGWEWENFSVDDRGLLITYIYSVEKVLRSVGIKKARLRPHPINNKKWVERFVDNGFFELDYQLLDKSLSDATLVIGPTSSTFLESLIAGVTYLAYEPGGNKCTMNGFPLVPPFDGSDPMLRVAFSEEELATMITEHYTNDVNILDKYIMPFNIDNIPML